MQSGKVHTRIHFQLTLQSVVLSVNASARIFKNEVTVRERSVCVCVRAHVRAHMHILGEEVVWRVEGVTWLRVPEKGQAHEQEMQEDTKTIFTSSAL